MTTRIFILLAMLFVHLRAMVPCSTVQECRYQGCIQPALEGNFFGCNCVMNQMENSADGSSDTRCYAGEDEEMIDSGRCVYSTDYGISFQYCPCRTSCPAGQYLDGCQCQPCPSGHFCTHSHAKRCTICENDEYEEHACTASADTVCRSCTQCQDGTFQLQACTKHSNTRCGLCKYCKQGYYTAVPCTNLTDAECSPCSVNNWCPGNGIMYEPIKVGSKIYRDPNSI